METEMVPRAELDKANAETAEERKERLRLEDKVKLLEIRAEQAEKEAKEANIDEATGLLNRRGFKKAIEQLSNEEDMSIMILDIDNFKKINDTYGHTAGDEVLQAVSKYLSGRVRESDIVARWGGEEFVIVFRKIHAQKAINKFYVNAQGERQEKPQIQIPVAITDKSGTEHMLTVTFSGGVAEFNSGDNISEAVAEADEAQYEAKAFGKNIIRKAK